MTCPYCGSSDNQVRAGYTNGSQRFKCTDCRRRYTLPATQSRYSDDVRTKAVTLRGEGHTIRQIANQLGVNHQSVANWLRSDQVQPARRPDSAGALPIRRRTTITDVARRAGVSVTTVSNYLNQKGRMAEDTRSRIKIAMDELHFAPSALVRAIRQQTTKIIGVLMFGLSLQDETVGISLTPPLLGGIVDSAEASDYDVLLYTRWNRSNGRNGGLDFLNGHIDGLLWVDPPIGSPVLDRLAAAGLPVVALLTRHVPESIGYVNIDNFAAMTSVIDHLCERGHRRIAYIGQANASNFMDRHLGYRQALEAKRVPFDPVLEVTIPEEQRELRVCSKVLAGWLALDAPPTAVICSDDSLAALMGSEIEARGIGVPESIALTGFDDIPMAQHCCGGLTTVRQPLREIGRRAAHGVLAMINGAPAPKITVSGKLIVRHSTGF